MNPIMYAIGSRIGVALLACALTASAAADGAETPARRPSRQQVSPSAAAEGAMLEIETWRVKATILVLVEPVGSTSTSPAYKVVTWDEPANPNTERGARSKAANWVRRGVFVPGPDPQPAETFGTHYPAHRVQSVEVYVVF